MSRTYAASVAAGMRWLDEHMPDWEPRIDLDRLDLGHGQYCIRGQLTDEPTPLVWPPRVESFGETYPAKLGFSASTREGYAALTRAWKRAILKRRV
jgi:hypothetical protein